ncbi:MAG: nicotinate phosphoribosyltransferase [Bacilli bacterium]|nr:nicotinate phosphoribosyltransferase [Bacilli bacterium]
MMMLSILDTDLYKASTSYAYWSLYPLAEGTFTFNDRNKETYDQEFIDQLKLEFTKLGSLRLKDDEFEWAVKKIPYIPLPFWEWLKTFKFEPTKIHIGLDSEGHLEIEVTDFLYKVTWYEIPVLAIVSELRNKYRGYIANHSKMIEILDEKINMANEYHLKFSEFGTRRRYSAASHDSIVGRLKERCPIYCVGTSNMYLAMKYGITPSGTFPHEWIQAHAGMFGNKRANYLMLEAWIKVYRGDLGTALTDLFGTESFLRTLTRQQALLLQGYRIDSGDNFKVGNMIIDRLKEFKIDPKTKLLVFSNALDFPKYKEIYDYFNGRIQVSAGIGTNITCDPGIDGYKPANIVMKLSRVRMSDKDPWEKCIKISDDLGKHIGDPKEIEIAKYELHIGD